MSGVAESDLVIGLEEELWLVVKVMKYGVKKQVCNPGGCGKGGEQGQVSMELGIDDGYNAC